mmetsp:Transcript_89811/g.274926  ORF Transcript_89811/g.274926 Transcript_89811/m.274926 type:complete len:221 (+) Transcript_89811:562-1224(+)
MVVALRLEDEVVALAPGARGDILSEGNPLVALEPCHAALALAQDATGRRVRAIRDAAAATAQVDAQLVSAIGLNAAQALVLRRAADPEEATGGVLRASAEDARELPGAHRWDQVLHLEALEDAVVEGQLRADVPRRVGHRDVRAIPELLRGRSLRGARVRGHVVPPEHRTARLHALGDDVTHGELVGDQVALAGQNGPLVALRHDLAQLALEHWLPPPPA